MFQGKQIVIYVYDNLDVDCLVDTVIHEYSHYLQFEKKASEQDYNKQHEEMGYWDNPYEVKAREIAKQKRKECLNWVLDEIKKSWSA